MGCFPSREAGSDAAMAEAACGKGVPLANSCPMKFERGGCSDGDGGMSIFVPILGLDAVAFRACVYLAKEYLNPFFGRLYRVFPDAPFQLS